MDSHIGAQALCNFHDREDSDFWGNRKPAEVPNCKGLTGFDDGRPSSKELIHIPPKANRWSNRKT